MRPGLGGVMATSLTGTRRRGISGLMQVAMIVGIVIIFAGVLFSFAGNIFSVQTVTDSISMQKVLVHKVAGTAFLSANVKNTGTVDIIGLQASVWVETDGNSGNGIQPFTASLRPVPLAPGMTASVYTEITESDGSPISLSSGREVAVIVNATTADNSLLTETVSARVG